MDNFIFSKIMWLVRWGWVCSKREYIYISCLGSLSECSLLTCFCFLCSHQCLQRINRKGFKIKAKQRKRRDHMKRAEKWNCRSERQRAERVEKWRPASIFFRLPVLVSLFSVPSFSANALFLLFRTSHSFYVLLCFHFFPFSLKLHIFTFFCFLSFSHLHPFSSSPVLLPSPALKHTHIPQQWWHAFSGRSWLSPEHLLRYTNAPDIASHDVCVSRAQASCAEIACLCVRRYRSLLYTVSEPCIYEWMCSIDLSARGCVHPCLLACTHESSRVCERETMCTKLPEVHGLTCLKLFVCARVHYNRQTAYRNTPHAPTNPSPFSPCASQTLH